MKERGGEVTGQLFLKHVTAVFRKCFMKICCRLTGSVMMGVWLNLRMDGWMQTLTDGLMEGERGRGYGTAMTKTLSCNVENTGPSRNWLVSRQADGRASAKLAAFKGPMAATCFYKGLSQGRQRAGVELACHARRLHLCRWGFVAD